MVTSDVAIVVGAAGAGRRGDDRRRPGAGVGRRGQPWRARPCACGQPSSRLIINQVNPQPFTVAEENALDNAVKLELTAMPASVAPLWAAAVGDAVDRAERARELVAGRSGRRMPQDARAGGDRAGGKILCRWPTLNC
jgi:hypothetical protein